MMNKQPAPQRWWDLPSAALLLAALLASSTRLVAAKWTDHLALTETLVVFGALAGFALGKSRFSPRWVAFFSFVYGLFMVGWQLALPLDPKLEWSERMLVLAGRLNVIVVQLIRKDVLTDSLLFLVLMCILYWYLGVYGGYTLVRYGDPWRAALPSGLVMLVVHLFDLQSRYYSRLSWYLAVYIFFTLVLVARVAYLHSHARWQATRTNIPPYLGLDFIRFTLLAAGLIVVFAWSIPALASALPAAERAWQPVRDYWREASDQLSNMVAYLRSSVGYVSDYYGSSVLLGRGNRLTDNQVFSVSPPADQPKGLRLYWRARTYDTYNEGQWVSTVTDQRVFNPEKPDLSFPLEQQRFLGLFAFHPSVDVSTLFSPSQPMWVNRQAVVEAAKNPDGSADISAFRASPTINAGQVYKIQASISNATVTSLRAAGTSYPSWVKQRYLQVPVTITPRTRELAKKIAAGKDTPYDIVMAVTDYLRNNITYAEVVPNKPANREALDWFLFDYQQGFCNYYASAEVILLRVLGIPARWSIGYAQGEQLSDGTYLVRQRNAHAWPEVYFPGLGWVEFEPTSAQPAIERVVGADDPLALNNLPDNSLEEEMLRRQQEEELAMLREGRFNNDAAPLPAENRALRYGLLAGLLALAAGLGFLAWRYRTRLFQQPVPVLIESAFTRAGKQPPAPIRAWALRARQPHPPAAVRFESFLLRLGIHPPELVRTWARRATLPPLVKAYQEINYALGRMGTPPPVTATPTERAVALGQVVPGAELPARLLVYEYQLAVFSQQPGDEQAARQAGAEIRSLSYQAWVRKLLSRLQQPEKPKLSRLT